RWDGKQPLPLDYQSLVEMPLRYQVFGTDADRDILYALHGFQLKTFVSLAVVPGAPSGRVKLAFRSFQAQVLDRYDWDYSEHLTVPKPESGRKTPDAVAPASKTVVVYHRTAKRLEDAGLAAPYDLRTKPWTVSIADVVAEGTVDLGRTL